MDSWYYHYYYLAHPYRVRTRLDSRRTFVPAHTPTYHYHYNHDHDYSRYCLCSFVSHRGHTKTALAHGHAS